MRAVSLPHSRPGRPLDARVLFLIAAVAVLALLASAVLVLGASGASPPDGALLAPFRWNVSVQHMA
jgi:hypothetical protein